MILLLVAFFYVMISYALLARTEVFVQNSLNQASKEFSQYTYLLGPSNHGNTKKQQKE